MKKSFTSHFRSKRTLSRSRSPKHLARLTEKKFLTSTCSQVCVSDYSKQTLAKFVFLNFILCQCYLVGITDLPARIITVLLLDGKKSAETGYEELTVDSELWSLADSAPASYVD